MVTRHSIDLTRINEKCFAYNVGGACRIMSTQSKYCNSYKCPFYKPQLCKAWIRIEDSTGINLIPPEDTRGRRRND